MIANLWFISHKVSSTAAINNTKSNKKKMMTVPFGEDPFETVALYLKSDEGIEVLKFLEISSK